jgi:hypothetical protein
LGKRPPVVLISIATVGRVIERAIGLEFLIRRKKCKFMLRRRGEASDDRQRDEGTYLP